MVKRIILLQIVLLSFLPSNLYAFSPRFRDTFMLRNTSDETMVIVVPEIGKYFNSLNRIFKYADSSGKTIEAKIPAKFYISDPQIFFRRVEPQAEAEIGWTYYHIEKVRRLPVYQFMQLLFPVILVFDEHGDLVHNISDFSRWEIVDENYLYSLIADGEPSSNEYFPADDSFRAKVIINPEDGSRENLANPGGAQEPMLLETPLKWDQPAGDDSSGRPRFSSTFMLRNTSDKTMVIVIPEIGRQREYFLRPFEYTDSSEERIETELAIHIPGKIRSGSVSFRTLEPREEIELGTLGYDMQEITRMPVRQVMDQIFSVILVFEENGDLIHNISDFSRWEIESEDETYYLLADGLPGRKELYREDDYFREKVVPDNE